MKKNKKNNLRNAIIKALGGFTENHIGPPDLPPSILPSVKSFKFDRVKAVVTLGDSQADPRGTVSDMRMQIYLREQLAAELDSRGLIKYAKKTDARGTVLEASIYVGQDRNESDSQEDAL